MKTLLSAILVLLAAPAFAQQSAPEIAFDSVPDYPKLPKGLNFGEVPGVAVNSKGHVYHALEQRRRAGLCAGGGAVARIRPERRIRGRNRQGKLRLVLRPHGARRQ